MDLNRNHRCMVVCTITFHKLHKKQLKLNNALTCIIVLLPEDCNPPVTHLPYLILYPNVKAPQPVFIEQPPVQILRYTITDNMLWWLPSTKILHKSQQSATTESKTLALIEIVMDRMHFMRAKVLLMIGVYWGTYTNIVQSLASYTFLLLPVLSRHITPCYSVYDYIDTFPTWALTGDRIACIYRWFHLLL